ncbi:ring-opening amidohydrolase [Microbacterium sp.]|uniref:ring-opening amidohydrolase n=1 Tax=Microbacterium sp. TaxID=51671 RepID=UPI003A8FDCE4
MSTADLTVLTLGSPEDPSPLRECFDAGLDPAQIVAVIGKTGGTGLGDDPVRAATVTMIERTIADAAGREMPEIAYVLSGGSPGLITPHIAVITRDREATSGGLAVGTARSGAISPGDLGRQGHIDAVIAAVGQAQRDADLMDPRRIHAVMVKSPSLTTESVAELDRRGLSPISRDLGLGPAGAMCFINDAAALGVAAALGEIDRSAASASNVHNEFDLFSEVAMTSAGGERTDIEVIVLGNASDHGGALRIGHSCTRDPLDLGAVERARVSAGADIDDSIRYAMGKMTLPRTRTVRGNPIGWHDEAEAALIAKAMGGALLAATTGDTRVFLSGGEHVSQQGPADGNPVAVVFSTAHPASTRRRPPAR